MQYDIFDSPLGKLTVSTDGSAITGLHIEGDRYFTAVPANWEHNPNQPLLKEAKIQLKAYFVGTRENFDLPLQTKGTPFQQQVWEQLRAIPSGATSSYSVIAQNIGKPNAVRAVGTAVGHNPICIIVPCHRVLTSSGALGGFVAGLARKQQLLGHETVATVTLQA